MAERLYSVLVTQAFEREHIIRAASKVEARQIVVDLTRNRIDPNDPRIVESWDTGTVGDEKVSSLQFVRPLGFTHSREETNE